LRIYIFRRVRCETGQCRLGCDLGDAVRTAGCGVQADAPEDIYIILPVKLKPNQFGGVNEKNELNLKGKHKIVR
jgi:hypothetical protein